VRGAEHLCLLFPRDQLGDKAFNCRMSAERLRELRPERKQVFGLLQETIRGTIAVLDVRSQRLFILGQLFFIELFGQIAVHRQFFFPCKDEVTPRISY